MYKLRTQCFGSWALIDFISFSIQEYCCLRVEENPAYGGQLPASPNNPMKLNLKLDCNPAHEGSTFNLDKDIEAPDPAYELVHYSSERQRLESKAHEYEIPTAKGMTSNDRQMLLSGEQSGLYNKLKFEDLS